MRNRCAFCAVPPGGRTGDPTDSRRLLWSLPNAPLKGTLNRHEMTQQKTDQTFIKRNYTLEKEAQRQETRKETK